MRIFILFLLLVSCSSFSQTLYILGLSKTDKTLVVLDYNSLEVMAKISVGEDLHEVVASGDGSAASIANTVNGTAHEINVIDLKI